MAVDVKHCSTPAPSPRPPAATALSGAMGMNYTCSIMNDVEELSCKYCSLQAAELRDYCDRRQNLDDSAAGHAVVRPMLC